jgi:hypothetical protein
LKQGELTDEAKNTYEMLAQRQPMTFPINKEKTLKKSNTEIIGNLPLHLFWTRKPILTRFDKNTGIFYFDNNIEKTYIKLKEHSPYKK